VIVAVSCFGPAARITNNRRGALTMTRRTLPRFDDMDWPTDQVELLQRWIDGGTPQ
jgi:hypothetical protein